MNRYEEKQEVRRARLEARADRLRQEGAARMKRGDDALRAIPLGQPILVGHHSEKRDRNYRARAANNLRAGYDTLKAATEVAGRAAAVGTGGVSSDDPDAIAKLTAQAEKLEGLQITMTVANKVVRKFKADVPGGVKALMAGGFPEARAAELFRPDFAGRLGFPDYAIANNRANIRRIRERITGLMLAETRENRETLHNSGVRIVENADHNRLQLFFPGKPDTAIRAELKSAGFRWAPSEGAWQRQLSVNARWSADRILEKLI